MENQYKDVEVSTLHCSTILYLVRWVGGGWVIQQKYSSSGSSSKDLKLNLALPSGIWPCVWID